MSSAQEKIAAPSDLKAVLPDGGGVHLTWKDNSDDEAHFMLFRKMKEDKEDPDSPLASPKADEVAYHDTDVESGMTYLYWIISMDSDGNASERSNEAEIDVL